MNRIKALLFLPCLFLIPHPTLAQEALVGIWERSQSTDTIIECGNGSEVTTSLSLFFQDENGRNESERAFEIQPNGAIELALPPLAGLRGTFRIDGELNSQLACQSIIREKSTEIAIPAHRPFQGKSFVLFNNKPQNNSVVRSEFTLVNTGEEPLKGTLLVQGNVDDSTGFDLAPGEHQTLLLGERAVVGFVEILPEADHTEYLAYVKRIVTTEDRQLSMLSLTQCGTCQVKPIGLPILEGTSKVVELGNPSAEELTIELEVRSKTGEEVFQKQLSLPPLAIREFILEDLPSSARTLRVRFPNQEISDQIVIFQVAVYEEALQWAYLAQPPRYIATTNHKVLSLVRTGRNQRTEQRYLERDSSITHCQVDIYQHEGEMVAQGEADKLPFCNTSVQEEGLALAVSVSNDPSATYSVETERFLLNDDASIKAILQTHAFVVPRNFLDEFRDWEVECSPQGTLLGESRTITPQRKKRLEEAMKLYGESQRLRDEGRIEEAIAKLRETLEQNPKHKCAMFKLGQLYGEKKDNQNALLVYQRLKSVIPNSPTAHHNLAVALQRNQQIERAIGHYRKAVKLDPGRAMRQMELGRALIAAGEHRTAIGYLRRALELEPAYSDALLYLGNAYWKLQDWDAAGAYYRRALVIAPDYDGAQYNLASILFKKGLFGESVEQFEILLERSPDFHDARKWLVQAREKLKLFGPVALDQAISSGTNDMIHPSLRNYDWTPKHGALANIDELLEIVGSTDRPIPARREAVSKLGEAGEAASQAVDVLLQVFNGHDSSLRNSAGWALSKIGIATVEPLIEAIERDEVRHPPQAIRLLNTLGPRAASATTILATYVREGTKQEQFEAVRALGAIAEADPEAGAALMEILPMTRHAPLQREIILALGDIRATEAAGLLAEKLSERNKQIRWAAARSLGLFGRDAQAVTEELIRATTDNDRSVVVEATRALGFTRDSSSVATLIELLDHSSYYVHTEAAGALERIGGPSALTALENYKIEKLPNLISTLSEGSMKQRCAVANAIGNIGAAAESAIPAFQKALHNGYWGLRVNAARALGEMGQAAVPAVPQLISILRDDIDARVAVQVAGALALIGGEQAEAAVRLYAPRFMSHFWDAARTQDPKVRRPVRTALALLAGG